MRYKRITLSTVSRMKMPQPAMSEGAMKSFLPRWRWTITFLVAVKLTQGQGGRGGDLQETVSMWSLSAPQVVHRSGSHSLTARKQGH